MDCFSRMPGIAMNFLVALSVVPSLPMEKTQNIVMVYAESTPNPAAMKFVVNQYLLEEGSVEYLNPESAGNCPLAQELFKFDGVASVFITANFVTINKKKDYDWFELMPIFREFIKGYIVSGEKVFT